MKLQNPHNGIWDSHIDWYFHYVKSNDTTNYICIGHHRKCGYAIKKKTDFSLKSVVLNIFKLVDNNNTVLVLDLLFPTMSSSRLYLPCLSQAHTSFIWRRWWRTKGGGKLDHTTLLKAVYFTPLSCTPSIFSLFCHFFCMPCFFLSSPCFQILFPLFPMDTSSHSNE